MPLNRPWELAQRGEVDPGIDAVVAGATAEDGSAPVWCDGNKEDLIAWLLSDVFPDNQTLAREVAELYPAEADKGRLDDGSMCSEWYVQTWRAL